MSQQQEQAPHTATATAAATPTTSGAPIRRRRHLPQVLVAKMLTMILQNGTAIATSSPRPNSLASLNTLRTELLLHCPFFDPAHNAEELGPRARAAQVSFTDIVVLMARLMRVLMKGDSGQGSLSEEEARERVELRNECFDQPFFDRQLLGSGRPFGGDEEGFLDEGCVV